jgi:prolipoprotein diacylglyceryltransferase
MQQVLFTVPILKSWFPPDGIPLYGFGAMLFVTFVVVAWWGTVRAKKIGMEAARFQDFCIWVFLSGLVGARVLYMVQYAREFPNNSLGDILASFFRIWEGGIVFYGSALGGAIGYGLFYWFVMRRLTVHVSGWQLADAVAPLLALGLAIGRIGCYLNGCCWGQVANEEVCVVPLGPAHFPILPAHARKQLVSQTDHVPYGYLQTSTGFAVATRGGDDPRPLVTAVEVGSPAEKAGVKAGDKIVRVNNQPTLVANLSGPKEQVEAVLAEAENPERVRARVVAWTDGGARVAFDDLPSYLLTRSAARAAPGVTMAAVDRLDEITSSRDWPRGKSQLDISVERVTDTRLETIDLPPFVPVTVGLYPTQLYETLSMVLLIFVLLAYYPYRRHDGQLMVVLMIGYAVHRFVNESMRIEPAYRGGLTLSQWASVIVLGLAVAIEVYLWRTMPSRWKGEPQYVAVPAETKPDGQSKS